MQRVITAVSVVALILFLSTASAQEDTPFCSHAPRCLPRKSSRATTLPSAKRWRSPAP